MADLVKYLLTRIGEQLSSEALRRVNAVADYLEVGRWMRVHGYRPNRSFSRREELFDSVAARIARRKVLYLEFGVYRGDATRYWSKLLLNPNSRLHGFDSFEGLPDDWLPHRPAGHFSLGGSIPRVDDSRVQFFKGWFGETLPVYTPPPHEVLVLNFDADLYSSTVVVLDALEAAIVPGTFIYFDEFNHRAHELRAFDEFITRTGMTFNAVGATRTLEHVVFQRT
jgi:hypothetical protein